MVLGYKETQKKDLLEYIVNSVVMYRVTRSCPVFVETLLLQMSTRKMG
jgi:hypothetical protein